MKKLYFFLTILTVSVIALGYAFAHSNYTGRTRMSGTAGCGGCHASLSTTVQVSISGPDTLPAGAKGSYQVRISGGSGSTVCADIAASAGTLAPADANLKLSKGELITNGTKRYSAGSYTYSFVYTAPASPQTATLYATGLSTMSTFNFAPNKTVVVTGGTTSVAEPILAVPLALTLEQNFPNPFNPSTSISYTLKERALIFLQVFDSWGRHVATLDAGSHGQGTYNVDWNADESPSGVYYYRLQGVTSDNRTSTITRKMLLQK